MKMSDVSLFCLVWPCGQSKVKDLSMRNALTSWTRLRPRPEIILLGEDSSVEDLATRYDAQPLQGVERNPLGHPSIASIYALAQEAATRPYVLDVNSDIILLPDLPLALEYTGTLVEDDHYTVVSGRCDGPIGGPVDFSDPSWPATIQHHIAAGPSDIGSDIAVWPRGALQNVPDFSVGRAFWDGWRMRHFLEDLEMEMVDIGPLRLAVHQRHGHRIGGDPGVSRNIKLSGGRGNMCWVRHATKQVDPKQFKEWRDHEKRILETPLHL